MTLSGEFKGIERIYKDQEKHGSIVRLALTNQVKSIKCYAAKQNDFEVMALGTFRVSQFRDLFFKESDTFYNASGAIQNIQDFQDFFENSGLKFPKLLIISLDHYFFNETWLKGNISWLNSLDQDTEVFNIYLSNFGKVWRDCIGGKISIPKMLTSSNIGISAQQLNEGFRFDGSYQYINERDRSFSNVLQRINNGNARFEYGAELYHHSISCLKHFLNYCSQNNIHLVAFLPPYPKKVLDAMDIKGENYGYMDKIYNKIQPFFEKYKFSLFDFTSVREIGGADDEFIDGLQGSELCHLRMLFEMTKGDRYLQSYCDVKRLEKHLKDFSARN